MGNDNSNDYDRNEKIRDLEKKKKNLDDVWDDPFLDVEECFHADMASLHMTKRIERLKEMNQKDEKFSKINLDDYRNSDGSFDVYKVKRPLDNPSGNGSYESSSKLFHQGVGFGKEGKIIFSDYGTNKENSDIRFWDNSEEKDNWREIEKVGTSHASNKEIKDIFFGKNSEQWVDHENYSPFFHNCKDYTKEKIKELTEK